MNIKVNREEAFEAGVEQGIEQSTTTNIKNIMNSLGCDIDKAMDALNIPADKRARYKELIEAKL